MTYKDDLENNREVYQKNTFCKKLFTFDEVPLGYRRDIFRKKS